MSLSSLVFPLSAYDEMCRCCWRGGAQVTLWHAIKASASANAAASQLEAPCSPPQPRTWTAYLRRCSGLLFFRGLGAAALQPAAASSCSPKPLLIKSPVHTARVGLLLDIFPRARFVYIHRHPLQVWDSGVKV